MEQAKFPKGTVMVSKKTGTPEYEKLDNVEWGTWVSLTSNYLEEYTDDEFPGEKLYRSRPESEKPLYKKDGTLNRFGFKWTDHQVQGHYGSFMDFKLPG